MKKEAPSESHEAFEVAEAPTYGLLNLVLSPQTSFSSAGISLLINHRWPRLTVCVTYGFHNMSKYREHMGRSLGLEIR